MNDSGRAAPPAHLLLVGLAIFVMECLIALHTLWPNYPYLSLVVLWIGVVQLKRGAGRWTVALILGVVLGEASGYFVAVPWTLTWLCALRNQNVVPITLCVRLFCVLFALSAWAMVRRASGVSFAAPWRAWAADGGALALGLLLMASIGVLVGTNGPRTSPVL